mmetsp:Transcript_58540/g.164167  ORF Transcript_58540/g.164167 Transcript_58540/m.164167 type:complete len:251 (-) Transcript_58540:1845-2597(-)
MGRRAHLRRGAAAEREDAEAHGVDRRDQEKRCVSPPGHDAGARDLRHMRQLRGRPQKAVAQGGAGGPEPGTGEAGADTAARAGRPQRPSDEEVALHLQLVRAEDEDGGRADLAEARVREPRVECVQPWYHTLEAGPRQELHADSGLPAGSESREHLVGRRPRLHRRRALRDSDSRWRFPGGEGHPRQLRHPGQAHDRVRSADRRASMVQRSAGLLPQQARGDNRCQHRGVHVGPVRQHRRLSSVEGRQAG